MTRSFRNIREEIANVSAGYGVRGFGDVTGTPKVGEEESENPHIERVMQGAEENNALVNQFVKNGTENMYTFDDENWWKDKKEQEEHAVKNSTKGAGLEFDTVVKGKLKQGIVQEDIGGAAATVGNTAGSGYIAGVGVPLEGKPSNWGEPGISKKKQGKYKLLTRAKPNEVGSAMKEIPIQEEVKRGRFAGEETFIVPTHVFERAKFHKAKGRHWRTYIADETFHPDIREFAYKSKGPIIFEDEKTGYMCYARYGRKRRK